MLSKCANPVCTSIFRYLHEGKLIRVEMTASLTAEEIAKKKARQTEYYWLCSSCASVVTLAFDKQNGLVTVPLKKGPEPPGMDPKRNRWRTG